jgi:hypothetical protein
MANMIECHSIHTMRSPREGRFQARLLTYRKAISFSVGGTTGNMIVKIIDADSREKARRIMARWLVEASRMGSAPFRALPSAGTAGNGPRLYDRIERSALLERRALGGEG